MDTVLEPSRVLAAAANGVIDSIVRSGGDVETIFQRAGILIDDLDSPFNELDLGGFCNLFEESSRQTENQQFGLEFGSTFQPKRLGAIGYIAICSPTLSAALRNMELYFPSHQGNSNFSLISGADTLQLTYQILDPRIENKRQDAELSMGMFLNIFRAALGPQWHPLAVSFEHDKRESTSAHESIFDAPVKFGRRTNALTFRRSELDARMPEADPYLFAVIESFLKSRKELQQDPTDFADIVRNQIKLHLNGSPLSAAEIARVLGMTNYEFRRQLVEHQLTFRELLRAAREELALHFLKNDDLPLTEIAALLGYSELSAFSRAFRSWTGMSAQRYRRHGHQ